MNDFAAITSALRVERLTRRLRVVMCSDAGKGVSPNANYASDVFLRAAQLQSVGNGFQQDIETKLAALETELVAAIKTSARSTTKLVLQSGTRLIIDAFAGIKHDLTVKMNGLTAAVHARNKEHMATHHGVTEHSTVDLSGIVNITPILGSTLSEQLDKLASDTIFRFKAAVRTGVAAGDTVDKLAQRITGEGKHFNISARAVLALNIVCAAEPVTGLAVESVADAAKKRLLVQVRLMDATENSVNKVIQAAITAFANATDTESANGADTEKNLGWQWLAVQDANTCFPAGQKVLTPKGYVGIETLKVGDWVISGKGETRRITNCFARNSNEMARLRLSNGKTIICTPEHLFLSKNKHWIEAQYLRGVELTQMNETVMMFSCESKSNAAGQAAGIKCESVSIEQCESRVFDITVEGDHTFVVSGVVVHNCAQCEFYDGSKWDSEYEPIDDGPEYPGDPGLHPNCRCSLVLIDLDAKEVPQDMNFDDYLSQFSRSEQEAAFGKLALRQYQRGDITAAQLMGQKENVLTLEAFKNQ